MITAQYLRQEGNGVDTGSDRDDEFAECQADDVDNGEENPTAWKQRNSFRVVVQNGGHLFFWYKNNFKLKNFYVTSS